GVEEVEGAGDVDANLDGDPDGEAAKPGHGRVGAGAVDELQHEVVLASLRVVARGEPLDDVRVPHESTEPCLGVEPVDELPLSGQVVGEDFHGDRPAGGHVVAEKDGAHPTLADPPEEAVASYGPGLGRRGGWVRPVAVLRSEDLVGSRHGQDLHLRVRSRRVAGTPAPAGITYLYWSGYSEFFKRKLRLSYPFAARLASVELCEKDARQATSVRGFCRVGASGRHFARAQAEHPIDDPGHLS